MNAGQGVARRLCLACRLAPHRDNKPSVADTQSDAHLLHCRAVAQDQSLWRRLCLCKFMMPSCAEVENWRELYRWASSCYYRLQCCMATAPAGPCSRILAARVRRARTII